MKHQIQIAGLQDLERAAREFLQLLGGRTLVAFYAPLCKVLGVEEDAISSPTFAIVNEYRGKGGRPVFHFDFYRIDNPAEALDIGLYDYLDSGELCLMEWPENIEGLLPEETLRVQISVRPDGSRLLAWED